MKSRFYSTITAAFTLICLAQGDEVPRKLPSLTTSKNRIYQNVEIREVTPGGVKIRHESGTATIPFEELPEKLQSQLGGFDRQAADSFRKKEKESLREQEQAIDRELSRNQEEPPVKPAAPKAAVPRMDPVALPDLATKESADTGSAGKDTAAKQPATDRGILSARIVGYRTGIKRVEFKVRTNCQATLEVHQVIPDEHSPVAHTDTFPVAPNADFVREVWVFNNYTSDLFNQKGETLDSESTDKKTKLGGLARPTLK